MLEARLVDCLSLNPRDGALGEEVLVGWMAGVYVRLEHPSGSVKWCFAYLLGCQHVVAGSLQVPLPTRRFEIGYPMAWFGDLVSMHILLDLDIPYPIHGSGDLFNTLRRSYGLSILSVVFQLIIPMLASLLLVLDTYYDPKLG